MTNLEIKDEVVKLNSEIMDLLDVNVFTLNNEVYQKQIKIGELQKQCTHDFENNYCNYCNLAQNSN